jgi:uncharacterized protein YjiS (DUF1127 family)
MAHAANVVDFGDYLLRNQRRGLFARLAQAVADYRAYVALHAELDALSDRELADLDISRLSIRDIAREAVYGR